MSNVTLSVELGSSDLVMNLLWSGDVISWHLGPLIEWPCINVHADVLVLPLTQGYIKDAVNGFSGIHILNNSIISKFLKMFASQFLVVVGNCEAWLDLHFAYLV